MKKLQNIAVLIDADNTQVSKLDDVFREISTRGRIVTKRAYGNWKKDALKNWEDVLKRLAIKAQQQFDYVSGKNATDMALVIDTIDLLYKNIYDGFVIVSSDSDYTPLAIRLREACVHVMGIGAKKTPEPFRNSCDEFIFLENLSGENSKADKSEVIHTENIDIKQNEDNDIETVHELLKTAYDAYQDENGYVYIGSAGSFIKRTKPDFDSRTYGYRNLPKLVESFPEKYEVKNGYGKGNSSVVYKCIENSNTNQYIDRAHALLKEAFNVYKDEDGFAHIGSAGCYMNIEEPEFSIHDCGYRTLSKFLEAFPEKYKIKKEKNSILYKCLD